MLSASLATILLVWKCARLLGRDPVQAIVLVGLNPIVLLWGLGGVHNDFLTVFFIVLCLYLLLRGGTDGVVAGAPARRSPPLPWTLPPRPLRSPRTPSRCPLWAPSPRLPPGRALGVQPARAAARTRRAHAGGGSASWRPWISAPERRSSQRRR